MNINDQSQANCPSLLGGYPYTTFCPQQPVMFEPRKLTIESVDGGFIINGQLQKNGWRTVATNPHALARLIKEWCAQFEAKAG